MHTDLITCLAIAARRASPQPKSATVMASGLLSSQAMAASSGCVGHDFTCNDTHTQR
jgi:hypothetical protein